MATNQAIDGRWNINVPVPSGVAVGMPVLVGSMPGVVIALQPISALPGAYKTATIDLGGDCYFLPVLGATVISPVSGKAVKPGDPIYADGGTVDATTNITYNLTLDANTGGVLFGNSLDSIGSGLTAATCRVRLKG